MQFGKPALDIDAGHSGLQFGAGIHFGSELFCESSELTVFRIQQDRIRIVRVVRLPHQANALPSPQKSVEVRANGPAVYRWVRIASDQKFLPPVFVATVNRIQFWRLLNAWRLLNRIQSLRRFGFGLGFPEQPACKRDRNHQQRKKTQQFSHAGELIGSSSFALYGHKKGQLRR